MALKGIKVVEMLGLAPGPFCGILLAEFGASVITVQKILPAPFDILSKGKRNIAVNLKDEKGCEIVRNLCKSSDVLIDTYRPGVMEHLGLGPEVLMKDNPKLIYARLTGYGQDGPLCKKAGHDINYVAMSGVLSLLTRNKEKPFPPINLLADFGGGGLLCSFGILLSLIERSNSNLGQIIDTSMVEGTAYLASWLFRTQNTPIFENKPGNNMLDGGTHFYNTYETKDNKYIAVGAIEPQFYALLLQGLKLTEDEFPQFYNYDESKEKFCRIFKLKTQNEWCKIFDSLDACVTPVLSIEEAANHKHNVTRRTFLKDENLVIPKPAPKLHRTPGVWANRPEFEHGDQTEEVLLELGYSKDSIKSLLSNGVVYIPIKSSL